MSIVSAILANDRSPRLPRKTRRIQLGRNDEIPACPDRSRRPRLRLDISASTGPRGVEACIPSTRPPLAATARVLEDLSKLAEPLL
jgi:hypothetical protein